MSRTVLLIDHPVGKRDDRASRMLADRGYALHWCSPGKGDCLPDPKGDFCATVVYGGPESANDGEDKAYIRQEIDWIEKWVATERPFLGICLGAQMLARALDAPVSLHPGGLYEIGYVPVAPTDSSNGFLDEGLHVYHWHIGSGRRRAARPRAHLSQPGLPVRAPHLRHPVPPRGHGAGPDTVDQGGRPHVDRAGRPQRRASAGRHPAVRRTDEPLAGPLLRPLARRGELIRYRRGGWFGKPLRTITRSMLPKLLIYLSFPA